MIEDREAHWAGGRRPSMRPPARIESRIALAAVALAVGFLVAVQVTGGEPPLSRLAAERPEDLTRVLADLGAEADALTREVAELRVRISRYRGSARDEDIALRDARDALADLQVLSGVTPVEGPGVVVALEDPEARVGWESMLDLVQELRDAGAEAIAVGDVRVVASTWFGPAQDAGLVVDGSTLAPPYEVSAIGPGEEMAEALGLPGGPLTVIGAQPGVGVEVLVEERLTLPAAS